MLPPFENKRDKRYLQEVVTSMKSKIGKLLSPLYENKPDDLNLWVAGGCFASYSDLRKPKDIDIFSDNPDKVISFLRGKSNFIPRLKNSWVYNFSHPELGIIQVIRAYKFNSPEELLRDFDFLHVQICYDGSSYTEDSGAWLAMRDKKLVVINVENPVSILSRVVKKVSEGYTIDSYDLGKLVREINSLDSSLLGQEFYSNGVLKTDNRDIFPGTY